MSQNKKIIISVVIVVCCFLLFSLGIWVGLKEETSVDSDSNYINQNKTENTIENEIIENKVEEGNVTNINTTESQNNTQINNITNNEIIGREEEQGKKDLPEESPKERAERLAREAFGENNSAYQFEACNLENNIYTVEVRSVTPSSSQTMAYYKVNMTTNEVTKN